MLTTLNKLTFLLIVLVSVSLIFAPLIANAADGPFNFLQFTKLEFDDFNDPLKAIDTTTDKIPALNIIDTSIGGRLLGDSKISLFNREDLSFANISDSLGAVMSLAIELLVVTIKITAQIIGVVFSLIQE